MRPTPHPESRRWQILLDALGSGLFALAYLWVGILKALRIASAPLFTATPLFAAAASITDARQAKPVESCAGKLVIIFSDADRFSRVLL